MQHFWDEISQVGGVVGGNVVVQRDDPLVVVVLAVPHLVDGDDVGVGGAADEGSRQPCVEGVVGEALQIDLDPALFGKIADNFFQGKLEGVSHDQHPNRIHSSSRRAAAGWGDRCHTAGQAQQGSAAGCCFEKLTP